MSESTALEWANNIHVRVALAAAGEPDGTRIWQETFTRTLLASVDSTSELAVDDMLDAVATWNWHLRERYNQYCETLAGVRAPKNPLHDMPVEIPRMLLTREVAGRRMDFEHCAWLLQVTEDELERVLWGRTDDALVRLQETAAKVLGGTPLAEVRTSACQAKRLAEYLRLRHGWVSEERFTLKPHVVETAIHHMEATGQSVKDTFAWFKYLEWIPAGVHLRTFERRVAAAREQMAVAA